MSHMAITVHMTKDRETKGTYVYKSDKEDAAVTQLYVRKSEMDDAPDKIKFTIEAR
jgi:hypothetical protein